MKLSEGVAPTYNNEVIARKRTKNQSSTMLLLLRESCYIFAVLFTVFAIINTQPKVHRGTVPTPFFLHSGVRDFYKGDLSQLMQEITMHHYAFVMYYAPWDADSQDAKNDFIETSLFYGDRVYFAAVNCWEPLSECRSTFKEIISPFPQLVAYVGPGKAIEYKGPHDVNHMIKFIHSILHPFVRINSVSELWKLRTLHDMVLVGLFQFQGVLGGFGYDAFLETAFHLAARDHERHITVAVSTHLGLNKMLGLDESPSIVIYLWNQKIKYQGKADVDSILSWVLKQAEKGLPELNSNTLLPHTKSGAVMVMFTPRHPLATLIPYYHVLRRVAMNFNYCNNGTTLLEDDFSSYLLRFYSPSHEEAILESERFMRQKCKERRKKKLQQLDYPYHTTAVLQWDNATCYEHFGFCRAPSASLKNVEDFSMSFKTEYSSDAERVTEYFFDEKCALLERTPPSHIPKKYPYVGEMPTSCDVNKTFSFIALDSSRFSHLANGLGLQLSKMKHHTSVAIFDNEEVLKLNTTEVTDSSVTGLLKRYLDGDRQRPLRSVSDTINFHNSVKDKQEGETITLTELNTHSFRPFVMNQSHNVVLMYHSPYCSFCLTLSNLFLSLAHLLRHIKHLNFARIDGELNDLPWQYTVSTYPSVLFVPIHRKCDSRIFHHELPLTMHSLTSFIVSNLHNYERIPVMLALCSRWGENPMATSEGETCLRDVRTHLSNGISQMLRRYRMYLLRLQFCSPCSQEAYINQRLKSTFAKLVFLKTAHNRLHSVANITDSVVHLENVKSKILSPVMPTYSC